MIRNLVVHDFGFGEVLAHKHPNGGGWVADNSHVHLSAFVCSKSTVFNCSNLSSKVSLRESQVNSTDISGHVSLDGCKVSGCALQGKIEGTKATLKESDIIGDFTLLNTVMTRSNFKGAGFLANSAVGNLIYKEGHCSIEQSTLQDSALIGNFVVVDSKVSGSHINSLTKPLRVEESEIEGLGPQSFSGSVCRSKLRGFINIRSDKIEINDSDLSGEATIQGELILNECFLYGQALVIADGGPLYLFASEIFNDAMVIGSGAVRGLYAYAQRRVVVPIRNPEGGYFLELVS